MDKAAAILCLCVYHGIESEQVTGCYVPAKIVRPGKYEKFCRIVWKKSDQPTPTRELRIDSSDLRLITITDRKSALDTPRMQSIR